MQRYNPIPIDLVPRRQVYFHATSEFLFNASTSMWVSDSHVVSPFGPTDMHNYPDFLPEGTWKMETKVFQMDSTCERMQFREFQSINRTVVYEVYDPPGTNMAYHSASNRSFAMGYQNYTYTETIEGFTLESDDGCRIQVLAAIGSRGDHRIVPNGGLFWTNLSSSYITYNQFVQGRGTPPFFRATEWSPTDTGLMLDFSEDCIGRNLLLVTTPWENATRRGMEKRGFQVRAELCTSDYYEATMEVTATVTSDAKVVSLNSDVLRNNRTKVPNDLLDLEAVQELTFGRDRLGYLDRAKTLMGNWAFEGLSEALSAVYSFNTTTMLENITLTEEATRLGKRFFGELILSAITGQQPEVLQSSKGENTRIEQRIVVVTETAVTLSVLLLLLSCYLLYLWWTGVTRHRQLDLCSDPATTFGFGAYLQRNPYIHDMYSATKTQAIEPSQSEGPSSTDESIHHAGQDPVLTVTAANHKAINKKKNKTPRTWKPAIIRSTSLFGLLLAFVLIAVLLLVLQDFASKHMLYRSAFVYQLDLRIFRARFSPQSVLATLLAVGVSMWWDAVDKTLRTLQPFLSMSKSTVDVRRGAALSYQSSYWIWATFRAALNSHWLLALVTLGTTMCQVLIVSMAAVFERGPGIVTSLSHAKGAYAIRQTPFTYNHTIGSFYGNTPFLQDTMRITTSDWLYSALDQITLGSEQPAWSRGGWSFTPVDMSVLPPVHDVSKTSASGAQQGGNPAIFSTTNTTLTTSGLRARLQCDKIETRDPSWFTVNEVDLFDFENTTEARNIRDRLNRTGYILPHTVFNNTTHETSIHSRLSTVVCCSNETDKAGRSAVGYWSQMNTTQWWDWDPSLGTSAWVDYGPATWPPNFAVKWIVGPTVTSNVTSYTNGAASNYRIMQFTEIPPMAFLQCQPLIERADARIVLAHGTGQVLDFDIVGEPQPQLDPWAAHFRHSNESDKKATIAQVSYGSYFLTQLLGASSIAPLVTKIGFYPPFDFENLDDDRFNIRDKEKGYNMDFMSYSNLYQANMDPLALLDTDVLMNYSQRTFQTFFQHFASQTKWVNGQMMAYESNASDNIGKVEVTTTQRIETLTMVTSATWLSLAIIFILVIIASILIVSLKIVYPHDILPSNIECLSDLIALVEGSEGLLWFAQRHDIKTLRESGLKTRLGWFKDRGGAVRWGIELIDAPGVEWIEKPGAFEMKELRKGGDQTLTESTGDLSLSGR
ncbi:hypothetical protein EKO04_004197 [Ascochyta lentis]|uniref:Uncharacterized protein n=1 Tax=Ascochyta lentis TaxID=205686 RepID=A0A8H7J4F7_9PLEO|nr:hypothetical protein EKO04_004197 [Ascochyta lentis]